MPLASWQLLQAGNGSLPIIPIMFIQLPTCVPVGNTDKCLQLNIEQNLCCIPPPHSLLVQAQSSQFSKALPPTQVQKPATQQLFLFLSFLHFSTSNSSIDPKHALTSICFSPSPLSPCQVINIFYRKCHNSPLSNSLASTPTCSSQSNYGDFEM